MEGSRAPPHLSQVVCPAPCPSSTRVAALQEPKGQWEGAGAGAEVAWRKASSGPG